MELVTDGLSLLDYFALVVKDDPDQVALTFGVQGKAANETKVPFGERIHERPFVDFADLSTCRP
jgi:hypothetical protein